MERGSRGDGRALTVVSVAYPFAPVSVDPVGGAEQVLAHLDRAIVASGHRSIVIAVEGSSVRGELCAIPAPEGEIDHAMRARAHAAVRDRLATLLAGEHVDVVHLHGVDFAEYLPAPGPAVLATLHLPLAWYPAAALAPARPNTWLQPVSRSQARTAPAGAVIEEPIENGVNLATPLVRKRGFALVLGRICPEKGIDDAIAAAARAGVPLLIAGTVFPYAAHREYLETRIVPRLGSACRWIGGVAGAQKKRLLAQARCVLVPSKTAETSSLVAMEAIAAGTPVIAYRNGALPEIVEDGRTGWIVDSVDSMAAAIGATDRIDSEACRQCASERFALERMTGAYLARYAELAARTAR